MVGFLKSRWFLISLVLLITGGLTFGSQQSQATVDSLTAGVNPTYITAIVLFLMAFSLDSAHLTAAFRSPRPVIWASCVNFGLIPLMAWPAMWLLLKMGQPPDFAYGLMIAASVPCTMAAASVWTRRAGGNDAVSLLVTVLTNGLCFLLPPFWLNLATAGNVQLDMESMVARLAFSVLIPTLAGQLIRHVFRLSPFADRFKTQIGVLAQTCILSLVLVASLKAGVRLSVDGFGISSGSVAIVWGACIVLHLVAMAVGVLGARAMGEGRAEQIAVAFASSQKTLPIGLLIATDPTMFGNPTFLETGLPFAMFPMMMYHASQLFIDTFIADRFAANNKA